MLSPWNFYLLLPISLPISLCVNALTRDSVKERQQPKSGTAERTDPMVGTEHDDFLSLPLSWPLSSSELSDRQGVIGEYADLQESTETSFVYPDEGGLIISRLTDSAAEDATSEESTQPKQQTLMQPDEGRNGSLLLSTQNGDNQPTFPALQKESALNGQVPFFSSGSPPSDQDSTSQLSAGPVPSPEHLTPQVATGNWEWTTGPSFVTQGTTKETVRLKETGDGVFDVLHTAAVSMAKHTGKSPSFDDIGCIHHLQYQ